MVEHHHDACAACGRPFEHDLLDFLSCDLGECCRCIAADKAGAYRRWRDQRLLDMPPATETIQ